MDTGDTTRKPRLLDFRKTIHSQFGEDGIIEKIFEIIGTTSKVCVEFGAWDGFFLSNTAALWTKDWKGVLIEAEQNKFLALLDNVRNYSCVPILAKVGIRGIPIGFAPKRNAFRNHGTPAAQIAGNVPSAHPACYLH